MVLQQPKLITVSTLENSASFSLCHGSFYQFCIFALKKDRKQLRLFRMVLSWDKTDYFSFPDTCKVGVISENEVVKNMIFENKYFAYLFTYESLCTY